MIRISLPLLFLFFLLSGRGHSQADTATADTVAADSAFGDRILMMNGREFRAKILEVGMGEVRYERRKDGTVKEGSVPIAELYSIDRVGKEERILYEKDSAIGNTLDRTQMRYFIRGERDAIDGYRTPWTTVGGLAIGATGAYFLDFSVFTLTIPLVYTLGATLPKVRIDKSTVSDPAYLDHEFYLKGYEREARGERLLNALKSSAGGVLIGLAFYAVLHPEQLR